MSSKTINLVLIIAGALLLLLSLLADLIGIGSYPGINWVQILGAAAGLVIILLGILRNCNKNKD